jgi:hypothetical protein
MNDYFLLARDDSDKLIKRVDLKSFSSGGKEIIDEKIRLFSLTERIDKIEVWSKQEIRYLYVSFRYFAEC